MLASGEGPLAAGSVAAWWAGKSCASTESKDSPATGLMGLWGIRSLPRLSWHCCEVPGIGGRSTGTAGTITANAKGRRGGGVRAGGGIALIGSSVGAEGAVDVKGAGDSGERGLGRGGRALAGVGMARPGGAVTTAAAVRTSGLACRAVWLGMRAEAMTNAWAYENGVIGGVGEAA